MLDIINDTFSEKVEESELNYLNKILNDKNLSDSDKKNAFSIALFFTNRFNVVGEETTLKKFTDFCLNKNTNSRKVFFKNIK